MEVVVHVFGECLKYPTVIGMQQDLSLPGYVKLLHGLIDCLVVSDSCLNVSFVTMGNVCLHSTLYYLGDIITGTILNCNHCMV